MIGEMVANLDLGGELDQAEATVAAPIAVAAKTAGELFGVGERSWRKYDAAGLVPRPVRLNGAVRWVVSELREWARAKCPGRQQWEEMCDTAQGARK